MDDDSLSISSQDTIVSKLSDFTQCTNTTFSKVHRLWKSGSDLQESVLSVLAAVTDVIKSNNGHENEVEYFAALLSSLTTADQSDSIIAAELYLLSLVISKVPKALLIAKFSQIADVLYPLLTQLIASVNDKGVRCLLKCLGVLLSVQPADVWECSSNERLFEAMLMLAVALKPSIRKVAQAAVSLIISTQLDSKVPAKLCSEFCLRSFDHTATVVGSGTKQKTPILHTLNLLRYVLYRFPADTVKKICEKMFQLLTTGDRVTASTVNTVLLHLFQMQPRTSSMPDALNAQLIMALYDFQPTVEDSSSMSAWLRLMDEAHMSLYEKNPQMGTTFRIKLMRSSLKLLKSESAAVTAGVIQLWQRTIDECIADGNENDSSPIVDEVLLCLRSTLTSPEYLPLMNDILHLFQVFLENYAPQCVNSDDLKFSLQTLADGRDAEMVPFAKSIDHIIGTVATRIGAEKLLSMVPLQINETNPELSLDFPRSFLLPVLRESIRKDRLKYFASYFLPLAMTVKSRADALEEDAKDSQVRAVRVLNLIQYQLWDLLPAFCNAPVDFVQTFPSLAPIIGTALIHRPDLRSCLLHALRRSVFSTCSSVENQNVLHVLAKDFLKVLLRLYLSNLGVKGSGVATEKGSRLDILETIRVWAQVTPTEVLREFFDIGLRQVRDKKLSALFKARIMNAMIALIPFFDGPTLNTLFEYLTNICSSKSCPRAMRKKLIRAFEVTCLSKVEACKQFFTEHRQLIAKTLIAIDGRLSKSAIGSCYHCFMKLLDTLPSRDDRFVQDVLLRATSTINADSRKLKKRSAELFLRAADELFKTEESFEPVVRILVPLKSCDEQHVAAVISALCLLVYEHRNDVPSHLLSQLLSVVCPRLSSPSRVIVHSCLRFLKNFVGRLSIITVTQYLDVILPAIFCQTTDCAHHFRFLTRMLLLKFIRKFSYEVIKKHVPESEQTRLKYIRKKVARETRSKSDSSVKKVFAAETLLDARSVATSFPDSIENLLRDSDEEESDSELVETKSAKSRFSRAKSMSTWIREDNDEEVIDLLDPHLMKHITVTDPHTKEKALRQAEISRDSQFKTAPDGRLVISADVLRNKKKRSVSFADEEQPKARKLAKVSGFEEEDEVSDDGAAMSVNSRRRKTNAASIRCKKGMRFADKLKAKGKKPTVRNAGFEPYAYIPLDLRLLHRRQRAKAKGKYRALFAKGKK